MKTLFQIMHEEVIPEENKISCPEESCSHYGDFVICYMAFYYECSNYKSRNLRVIRNLDSLEEGGGQ